MHKVFRMGKKNKKDIKESKESVQEELKENVDVEMEDKNESEETDQTDIGSEMTELRDKYLRLYAEFENYKKRTIREKLDMMKTAAQDTLAAILPVLDDFDRAKKVSDDDNSEESFSEGVTLVYHKLYTVLKNKGLEEMQSTGEIFDPEYHEAVTEIPAPSEDMKGKVVDTIEKGYMLKDRIIRHAKVVVGK